MGCLGMEFGSNVQSVCDLQYAIYLMKNEYFLNNVYDQLKVCFIIY